MKNNNNNNLRKGSKDSWKDDDEDDRKPPARPSSATSSFLPPPPSSSSTPNFPASLPDTPSHASLGDNTPTASVAGSSVSTFQNHPLPPSQITTTTTTSALHQKLMTVDETRSTALTELDPVRSNLYRGQSTVSTASSTLLTPQIVLASGTSGLALVSFLCATLPVSALVSLVLMVLSLAALAFLIYGRMLDEWNRLLNGRGIGDFLPQSVFQLLAEESFHHFMTNNDAYLEHRYLLLYFLPGLAPDEIERYVARLAPRHRETVMRPGLAQFLPNRDFVMTLLMGRQRWQPHIAQGTAATAAAIQRSNQSAPAIEVIVETDDDQSEASDLGLNVNENDMAGGLSDQQASRLARTLGLSNSTRVREVLNTSGSRRNTGAAMTAAIVARDDIKDQDDNDDTDENDTQDYYEEEENVLTEAFWGAFNVTVWPIYRSVMNQAARMTSPFTSRAIMFGSTLSVLSGGMALWGYYGGHAGNLGLSFSLSWLTPAMETAERALSRVTPPSMDRILSRVVDTFASSAQRLFSNMPYPTDRVVWATALAGGLTTGTALILRQTFQPPPPRRRHSLLKSWKKSDSSSRSLFSTPKK